MVFLLRCPKCKQRMKYMSRALSLSGKRKQCVYCGHSYKVTDQIIKNLDGKSSL